MLDLLARALTLRVVYAGPEGAAKFTALRGLHAGALPSARTEFSMIHAGGDRVVGFYLERKSDPRLCGCRVRWQVLSIPGALRNPAAERLLLRAADGVVFVPNRKSPASPESQHALRRLMQDLVSPSGTLTVPAVIVDYEDGEPRLSATDFATRLEAPLHLVPGDTLPAIGSVFDRIADMVLDRVKREGRDALASRMRTGRPDVQEALPLLPILQEAEKAEFSWRLLFMLLLVAALSALAVALEV